VALDYFATNCQPHASTRYLSAVETFEEPKNRFLILLLNTDSIVADAENPVMFIFSSPDLYARHGFGTVLNCVADKVLEDLHNLPVIAKRRWQIIARHRCSAFRDHCLQVLQGAIERLIHIDRSCCFLRTRCLAVRKEIIQEHLHALNTFDDVRNRGLSIGLRTVLNCAKRGLFRLWSVFSALFALLVVYSELSPIKEEFEELRRKSRLTLTDDDIDQLGKLQNTQRSGTPNDWQAVHDRLSLLNPGR